MSDFQVSFDGMKRMTSKFIGHLRDQSLSADAIEGAKSIWALHVINFVGTPLEVHQVQCLFSIGMREYLNRDQPSP